MRRVISLRGASGSGKSTLARRLAGLVKGAVVVSADDFFTKDGVYIHDGTKLGEAHSSCFAKFLAALASDAPLVVVDNTSVTSWEVSPYALASSALEYRFLVVTLLCDVEVAIARATHGAPEDLVREIDRRIRNTYLPGFWRHIVVDSTYRLRP
jgi:energy-coupling factor transporter ATP-binding protein EcfA2